MLLTVGQRILVTGAAGLLGGELCGRLVDEGHTVFGLINRNPEVRRNSGALVGEVSCLAGDVTQTDLGLDETPIVDMVIHCAAVTDFTEENEQHRAVNVEGTRNVLALCQRMGAKLLHISTAYVCGERSGVIGEDELDLSVSYTNGYESTKAQAEQLVRESTADWVIARPAIILGDHKQGRTRSFDTIYPILKVFAEGWVKVMPARPDATLNLVPIDYVCDGIMHITRHFNNAQGKCFHLCADEPTPMTAFPETLSKFDGLSFPTWVDPETFELATLRPAERRFFQRGAEVYASYFGRDLRFDDQDFRSFYGGGCPPTDTDWWYRIVNYCIDAGFIRPRDKKKA